MQKFPSRSPVATHTCAAACKRAIPAGRLMCATHWRLVPHELQQAVNRTWGAFNGAPGARAKLDARRAYLAARDAAIDSVQPALSPSSPTTTGEAQ
jgi:hypothetical protein